MSKKYDVCVRGAGVVGQVLALLLARERLRVALVAGPLVARQTDIRAYALNAASQALLTGLRAWPAEPAVTAVQTMWVQDSNADTPAELRFATDAAQGLPLSWIVDVPALTQRLTDAIGFQGGIDVLEEAPHAPLTVVCEGKRSSSRAAYGFEFDVRPYPQTAVAARLLCAQGHGAVARQWFADGEVMAWLPLDGPAGKRVALVWSVARERALELMALPPEQLALAVAKRGAQALGDMQMDGQPAAWPLELSRAQRWVARTDKGGVALAGDAAHALHPLAGQGLNVGLADVAELARVLHEREYWRDLGDLRLLRRYERARQADVVAMSAVTDGLFGLFSHTDGRLMALRQWGLRGFERSGPIKTWVTRQAMGLHKTPAGA